MIAAGRAGPAGKVETDERFGEVRYGDWTGRPLKELAEEPLWRVVQAHPSAARFPGEAGESLADAQHRAVAAVRDWNGRIAAEHGPDALYAVCSHGDIIKSVVADALGLHLTSSSASRPTPRPSPSSATPRRARSRSASTTPAAMSPGWFPNRRRGLRRRRTRSG